MTSDIEEAARKVAEEELQRVNRLLGTNIRIASSQRVPGVGGMPGVTFFFTDEIGRSNGWNAISVLDGGERAVHGLTLGRSDEQLRSFRASLTADDLQWLIPRNKGDFDRARAVVALGYPAVEPILPAIMTWVQDMNWPISRVIAPFLAGIGAPIAPQLREILAGDDDVWKYWIVNSVIGASTELFELFADDLKRLANNPTPSEKTEGVDEAAREVLEQGPRPWPIT